MVLGLFNFQSYSPTHSHVERTRKRGYTLLAKLFLDCSAGAFYLPRKLYSKKVHP